MAAVRATGKVTAIGPTGNLITDLTAEQLRAAPRNETTIIRCDEHETHGLFASDHTEPAMTFLAILNAEGLLELTIVGESARDMLGIRPGTSVTVEW